MSLITKVEIERFRCFEKLTVDGLSRVNLVVGSNNAGKTALLEAVEWLAAGGAPSRLWQQLDRRGQYYAEPAVPRDGSGEARMLDARELVLGRPVVLEGVTFRLPHSARPRAMSRECRRASNQGFSWSTRSNAR